MFRTLLDVLFPPRCVGCGCRGAWICESCVARFARLTPSRCPTCSRPTVSSSVCFWCQREAPAFTALYCAYLFEDPLRSAIHRLKYAGARHLAEPLANQVLRSIGPLPRFDATLPVPLHPSRLSHRGFNQSGLLARSIGRSLGVPVYEDRLRRIRDTPSQIELKAPERWRNVQGAFHADLGDLVNRSVLLVDDVATTGSTLRAAALALKQAGAGRVDAIVLARAL